MTSSSRRAGQYGAKLALLAAFYYAAGRLGLSLGSLPGNVAPIWPPTGLALAALFLFGPRLWPAVTIGAVLVNARSGIPLTAVGFMAVGNTLEAVVGAWLLRRFGTRASLDRLRDVGSLVLIGAVGCTLISATIGVAGLTFAGVVAPGDALDVGRVWWSGDALGVLIVTSALVSWWGSHRRLAPRALIEAGVLAVLSVGVALLAFQTTDSSAFLVFPVVMWAAIRFGHRGSTAITLVVAAVAVMRTAQGMGPFSSASEIDGLWLLDAYLAVLTATGLVLAALVSDRDRSHRELTQANEELESRIAERTQAVRDDRNRLEQAQRVAHIGSWEWDVATGKITWSDELHRLFGVAPGSAALDYDSYRSRLHPEDRDMVDAKIAAASATGGEFNFDHRIVLSDGTIRWLRGQGHVELLGGALSRMNGTAQDITDAKRAEDAIRSSEERTTKIVEAASDAFIGIDASGDITDWNHQAELTFGWSRNEVLGRSLADVIVPQALRDAHRAGMARFLATREPHILNQRIEVTALHRGGREFPVELAVWAVEESAGEISFHAFVHDVSERKASGEKLARALEDAREASRMKSAFVANMSHEIRTPMNGVMGMVGLLLDTELDAVQRDYVQTMATSAESLIGIINDVLDVSKIEAGKLVLEQRDFALRELLESTINTFRPVAIERCVRLAVAVDDAVPDGARGDRLRLRQVVSNLVSNALKFADGGDVEVRVGLNSSGALLFAVRDSGIGIPEDVRALLFQPFVQADASTTRRFGGTGLGLAICRQLVTLMRGEIGVESTDGSGSRFWFTIPFVAAHGPVTPHASRTVVKSERGGHILLVEDNVINRKVAVAFLEKLGYTSEVAVNGVEAVKAFTLGTFDAILMDCQMPEMDGYDATTAIRFLENGHRTPIVAMTAAAMASDRERCLAVGMDEYLSKPVDCGLLADTLRRCIDVGDTSSGPAEAPPAVVAIPG